MADEETLHAQFTLPTAVTFGDGCSALAGESARDLGGTRALVVTDKGVQEAGLVEGVLAALDTASLSAVVFDAVEPNPRDTTVLAARELARGEACDVLVAVGGGSVIDAAKTVGLLLTSGGEIAAYDFTLDEPRPIERPITPLVAVPTTAGTGSEVTFWAVVTDTRRRDKLGLGGPLLAPRDALVDPELTVTLPPRLTAFTGLDALTHAVEAYTTPAAGPLSDLLALHAVALVGRNLRHAVNDGKDSAARRDMSLASLLAGAAFTNADVGAVHCISEVVGGLYDLPHGLICGMYLPTLAEFNLDAAQERYASVASALGADVIELPAGKAAEAAVAALRTLTHDLGMPRPSQAGVRAADHAAIAARCAATIAGYAVPKPLTEADFMAVLQKADH
jgi:alcohol dehydrogenase